MGKTTNKNTAVLFFTLSASEEARSKNFSSQSFSQNKSVAQKLISTTYKTISETGLPVITVTSNKQVGNSFGERFANAFENLFEQGYERVIAVGNDCPGLSCQTIYEARRELKNNAMVVGPATDGGAYLIGLNKKSFKKNIFRSLSWKTGNVLYDLIKYSEDLLYSVGVMSIKADVDSRNDLLEIFTELKHSSTAWLSLLAETLLRILVPEHSLSKAKHNAFLRLLFIGSTYTHRGPPLIF